MKRALWGEQLYESFPVCDIEVSSNQLKPCENGFLNQFLSGKKLVYP